MSGDAGGPGETAQRLDCGPRGVRLTSYSGVDRTRVAIVAGVCALFAFAGSDNQHVARPRLRFAGPRWLSVQVLATRARSSEPAPGSGTCFGCPPEFRRLTGQS